MNWLDWLSLALVIVGALNWGLVGLGLSLGANWNVVDLVLGTIPVIENPVYVLVGLGGLYELYVADQLPAAQAEEPAAADETV